MPMAHGPRLSLETLPLSLSLCVAPLFAVDALPQSKPQALPSPVSLEAALSPRGPTGEPCTGLRVWLVAPKPNPVGGDPSVGEHGSLPASEPVYSITNEPVPSVN